MAISCSSFLRQSWKGLLLALMLGVRVRALADNSQYNNKVFVAGLRKGCSEPDLRFAFERYGPVAEVTIIDDSAKTYKTRKPFAFVTFESVEDAQAAVSNHDVVEDDAGLRHSLYCDVRTAFPPKPRPRSESRKRRNVERREIISRLSSTELDFSDPSSVTPTSDVFVLQCQSSHASRLKEYLLHEWRIEKSHVGSPIDVVGTLDSGSSGITLILAVTVVQMPVATVAAFLAADPFVAPALNQVYLTERIPIEISSVDDIKSLASPLLDRLKFCAGDGSSVRIQTFPPSLSPQILDTIQIRCPDVVLSRRGYDWILSVVRVDDNDGKGTSYLIGMSEASAFTGNINARNNVISRAYHKLREALERYSARGVDRNPLQSIAGAIAVDCGAAPGGWTEFLIKNGCQKVYAVDPGNLSAETVKRKECVHLQMKASDAFPDILVLEKSKGNKSGLGVFVSDMCLHNLDGQVDMLLEARNVGLLMPRTLFVLTLKCVIGYSKSQYDYQVSREVERLSDFAIDVDTFHLFSNRSGERTVIGYLK